MRKIGLALFFAGALAALFAPEVRAEAGMDTMLLWMIDDEPPSVNDHGTFKYINELGAEAARLRVDGGGYLGIYDSRGMTEFENAMLPLDSIAMFDKAGPVWSNLGEYSSAAHAFTVELGRMNGDEWQVLATSETVSYNALVEGGWTTSSALGDPREGPWTPTFAVPEPSSGLLLLLGSALLALRRRGAAGRADRAPYRDCDHVV